MNCREFEERLERLVAGQLAGEEERLCREHLGRCEPCAEVEALARIAQTPVDLVDGVLEKTTGGACVSAHERLCDLVDGRLEGVDSELVEGHLHGCAECRALNRTLEALVRDLPRLADVSPGPAFVEAVLLRTLPPRILLRRWWQRAWPRWVQRPRFAAEVAYIATLVLLLVVATPGSPLEAMPRRAVELARTPPSSHVTRPFGQARTRLVVGLEAVRDSEATGAVIDSWERTLELASQAADRSVELAGEVEDTLRTLWDQAASLLQRADESPSEADENTDEETS